MEKEEAPSSPSSPSLNPSAPLSPLNFQWRDPSLFFSLPRGAGGVVGVGVCAKATNCAGGDNEAAAPSLPFRFTLLLSSEHRSEPANAPYFNSNDSTAMSFVGKYERTSATGYEDFLKALDVNFLLRKAATVSTPVMEVRRTNGEGVVGELIFFSRRREFRTYCHTVQKVPFVFLISSMRQTTR